MMETNAFVNAIVNVPDFRFGLFDIIGATATSAIATMCGIAMTSAVKDKYMHPLKDMPQVRVVAGYLNVIEKKYAIAGMDVTNLVDRIRDPFAYWKMHAYEDVLTLWFVVEDSDTMTPAQNFVVTAMIDNIMIDEPTAACSTRSGYRALQFSYPYPFRVNIAVKEWVAETMSQPFTPTFMHIRSELIDWRLIARTNAGEVATATLRPETDMLTTTMTISNVLTDNEVFIIDYMATDGDIEAVRWGEIDKAIFGVKFEKKFVGRQPTPVTRFTVNLLWAAVGDHLVDDLHRDHALDRKNYTGCIKYSITNACRHVGVTMFRNCGYHDDTVDTLSGCYIRNNETGAEIPKISIGNDFCNRGCEAKTAGWRCCTCGYAHVEGHIHPFNAMLVHMDDFEF
ncbi:hypothetical protein Daus18300_012890 [Diaporthe australafricana]|uniref:Uncharacterized protein n=1 Tax=Diaporthe australafricana TaxID=127596 RepID=A0ABR3W132_9PEZI